MITTEDLQSTHHRIKDLRIVREEKWAAWHTLKSKEKLTKEEGKELTSISNTITSLTYEIRGLEIKFIKMSEQYIQQIVGD